MKRMLRQIAALVCAAAVAVLPLRAGTAQERIVRIAITGTRSLDPLLASNIVDNRIAAIAFDLLVGVDDRGNPIPRLASRVPTLQNGDISRDGLSITYHLRHGVKWHDGVPFTSKDVAFSWAAIVNPKNNIISRRGYDLVERVDTPDDYTAIFRLKRRFAPAVLTFFSESDQPYRIVPEHILGKLSDINDADFNQHPIGTGPFKFVRWDRGNQIEYVANPDYYLGRPKLDGVIVKEVPDLNTQVVEMKTHALDFMVLDSTSYEALEGVPFIKRSVTPINGYTAIMLNLASPALHDVAVRRALEMAIDKKAIAEKITRPTFATATADLPAFMWAYDPHVRGYPFDPAAARKVLEPLHLSLVLIDGAGSMAGRQIDVLVQSMLHNAGVNVELRYFAASLIIAPADAGGPVRGGKFDLVDWGWVGGADPDDSSQFTCDMLPPQGNNFAHYCDPAVDAAENIAVTSYDRAVRKRAYSVIERHLAGDVPMIFLWWPSIRLGYVSSLHGVRNNGITETWNINEWWLDN